MFNGGFRKAGEESATLPEDSPEAFDVLVEWVYQSKVRELKFSAEENRYNFAAVDVYILAGRLCLPEILDLLMDDIRKIDRVLNRMPNCRQIQRAYSNCPDGSPLRKYCAQMLYYATVTYAPTPNRIVKVQDELMLEDAVLKDFLGLVMGQSGIAAQDPREANDCDFHIHGKDGACYSKNERK